MSYVLAFFALLAVGVAFWCHRGIRDARAFASEALDAAQEALGEAQSPRLVALVQEYQSVLDEWLEKENAAHARRMRRLKAAKRANEQAAPEAAEQGFGPQLHLGAEGEAPQLTKEQLRAALRAQGQ